jgi:hypothetical protein
MILSENVEMVLSNRTYKKLVNAYNLSEEYKIGDVVKIPISILSKSSHYEIDITCDYCGKELKVPYKRYNLNTKVVNKYACASKDCSNQKIKDVCQVKYGVDNPFQADFVKDKSKKTIKEKWGVEHQMYVDEIKNKIKETCLERYGVDSYLKTDESREKIKSTCLKKYGVEHVLQVNEFREKGYQTNLKKWGVKYNQLSEEVRQKTKKTNIIRFGYDSNMKSDISKNKLRESFLSKYGVDNPMKSDTLRVKFEMCKNENYIKYLGDRVSLFLCDKGHNFEISSDNYNSRMCSNLPLCTVCNPIGDSQSIKEIELFEFIKSIYKGKIIKSWRDGLEIDIYLPEMNLGFEFNGLFWHSDKFKEKNYHLDKTKHFNERGIRIIHIWEDNWESKRDIIESQIKNILGKTKRKIFARKCHIKELKTVSDFLKNNHIQGVDKSNIKIGLFKENELVSVMTFNKLEGRNKMEHGNWNISRFCNKLDTNVIGGASKILNWFIKNYDPKRLLSYADKDWSTGDLYKKLGFNKISESKPDYKYVVKSNRKNKQNFTKNKLGIKEGTEYQYMSNLGYYRIWDCGKIKFEKVIN